MDESEATFRLASLLEVIEHEMQVLKDLADPRLAGEASHAAPIRSGDMIWMRVSFGRWSR